MLLFCHITIVILYSIVFAWLILITHYGRPTLTRTHIHAYKLPQNKHLCTSTRRQWPPPTQTYSISKSFAGLTNRLELTQHITRNNTMTQHKYYIYLPILLLNFKSMYGMHMRRGTKYNQNTVKFKRMHGNNERYVGSRIWWPWSNDKYTHTRMYVRITWVRAVSSQWIHRGGWWRWQWWWCEFVNDVSQNEWQRFGYDNEIHLKLSHGFVFSTTTPSSSTINQMVVMWRILVISFRSWVTHI